MNVVFRTDAQGEIYYSGDSSGDNPEWVDDPEFATLFGDEVCQQLIVRLAEDGILCGWDHESSFWTDDVDDFDD